MNDHASIALEKFSSGYNCAQAVLYAYCDELGVGRDTALRLACGFGGGMARRQETCGAVSGGVLAIGLKHGRGEGQERAVTDETYAKVRELISRFQAAHGSHVCKVLLEGCDLTTPEGQARFKETGLMDRTCKPCVATVVAALEDLL